MTKPVLLVIDDDPIIGEIIAYAGECLDFEVFITETGDLFIDTFISHRPTVIIMDLVMPNWDVNELLQWLATKECDSAIILISSHTGKYLKCARFFGNSLGLSVVDTLQKPISLQDIEVALEKALIKP